MLLVLPVVLFSPLLLISQFSCTTNAAATSFPDYRNCSPNDTYSGGTTFESNLLNLLSNLATNANKSIGFYNQSSGNSPDKVYGLIMCLADTNIGGCRNCLHNYNSEHPTLDCPGIATATVFHDSCMLSYSRKDFLSVADPYKPNFSPADSMWKDENSNRIVKEVLENLSNTAPDDPELFSFSNEAVTNRTNISALVQCTKDLSPNECKKCITYTMPYVQNYSENYSLTGVRIMARNCYIRYDSNLFNATSFIFIPQFSPPPRVKGRSESTRILVKIAIPAVILLIACLVAIRHHMLTRNHSPHIHTFDDDSLYVDANVETELQYILYPNSEYQVFDFLRLKVATKSFSQMNRLGKGSFGPVYKGIFPDGQEIAVKRLSGSSVQGILEFKNEVQLLAKLKHKNLVKLLGCSIANQEKLLCYEYLPNGSLDKILFAKDATKRINLVWKMRCKIIGGITRGLHYLHEESRLKIIHRDLKASNILLDKDMNPKISDFGIARFMSKVIII